MKGRETRSFLEANLRMSYDTGDPKLIGKAVPYDTLSVNPIPEAPSVKERIAKGAFSRSIKEHEILCLAHHDLRCVLGRSPNTLTLREDDTGVFFECLPPDVAWARDLSVSIKRGDVAKMSFSFSDTPDKVRWSRENGKNVREVLEGDLFEISVVTYPVYESTSVVARSAEGKLIVDGVVLDDEELPEKRILVPQFTEEEIMERFHQLELKNQPKIWR